MVIAGRQRHIGRVTLEQQVTPFREAWIDIGTGNGLFAYDATLSFNVCVIGVDANRDKLREYFARTRRWHRGDLTG